VADVLDVAQYILDKLGAMSPTRLQKLTYYSQAWVLVWTQGRGLFDQDFEAWVGGPVCRKLWDAYTSGMTKLPNARPWQLSDADRRRVDSVLAYYGNFNGNQLSDLTHVEAPWREARAGLPANVRSTRPISKKTMVTYYASQETRSKQLV
jgi:uncharacterized phage-associated protein